MGVEEEVVGVDFRVREIFLGREKWNFRISYRFSKGECGYGEDTK